MILTFLISIYISIILHEAAHLLAAKAVKCKVEIFSIGFGTELFRIKYRDTIYRIALFPLGGYNKLEDELNYSKSKYAFTNLSYSKKMLIILSGCFINILTGIIACQIAYRIPVDFFELGKSLFYFGYLSIVLGLSNLLPIPALDGSYVFLVWLEKFYGKKKGYAKMSSICRIGFIILMILNILCIPFLIYQFAIGLL